MKAIVVLRAMLTNWMRSKEGPLVGFVLPAVSLFILAGVYAENPGSSPPDDLSAIGYLLPGLVAAFIMASGVVLLGRSSSEMRKAGLLKRVSLTPVSKAEWMLGSLLAQLSLGFGLAIVMIFLGEVAYGTTFLLGASWIMLIVLGCLLFSGFGLLVARVANGPDSAGYSGAAIAFLMMVLSGTFWPVGSMPSYLQGISNVLPLTFFENGLRASLYTGDASAAVSDAAIMAAFALAFVTLGWIFASWD